MTYRLAIISDVHADLHALQDALEQIERLGCDDIVCAGDLVDLGRFPEETLALMDGIDPEHIDLAMADLLLRKADCDVLIVGHTHRAFRLDVAGGRSILNPAALLRDPAPGAENPPTTGTFGVLDLPSRDFRVFRAADGTEVEVPRRVLV